MLRMNQPSLSGLRHLNTRNPGLASWAIFRPLRDSPAALGFFLFWLDGDLDVGRHFAVQLHRNVEFAELP
jgi:hypothetical protein